MAPERQRRENDVSSIRETLVQLDQRLDDLRRQVATLVEEPDGHPSVSLPGDASGISVARLSGDGTPAATAPVDPRLEIHELLAACDRVLLEARELMGEHRAGQARPALFEGTVAVVALGANQLETIQVLEDSLARAAQVTRTYIRRAHAGEVRVELTLTGGVDLVGELNRVMPFPFAIRSATPQEIVIGLEGGGSDL
jgi:hypothetical protein